MPKETTRDVAVFDEEVSAVFKPVAVDIPKLVAECKGLKISGVGDTFIAYKKIGEIVIK